MECRVCSPLNLDNLRMLGRQDQCPNLPLKLYWTDSGLEFDLRGSTLDLEVEADYDSLEPWISVAVNGHDIIRMPVGKGRRWISLLSGLDPDQPHHIRLLRESQAMPGDPACMLAIHALRFDGRLAPLPEPKCRIEFIGDSLTSGEGAYGGTADTEWRPIWFAGSKGFPQLTADLLGGEARVISQSGWGVRSSWDNNPANVIPAYYGKVCGTVRGKGGNDAAYDFSTWKPDVIVCALGANDSNAIRSKNAFTDPVTGNVFKQDKANLQPFEDATVDFLKLIRQCNPESPILWVFWEKAEPVCTHIRKAIARRRQDGDENCFFESVPMMRADGARNHPGIQSHGRFAEKLAGMIKGYVRG